MLVQELMSADVVTVDRDASLDEAVERILDEGVGSVVVLADGNPIGIVTESDALDAALRTGRPLSEIPVRKLAHKPVIATKPDRTIQHVARRMADEGIKKVPVMDGVELLGIVTLTDVVWHLSDIRSEVSAAEAVRDRWESEKGV